MEPHSLCVSESHMVGIVKVDPFPVDQLFAINFGVGLQADTAQATKSLFPLLNPSGFSFEVRNCVRRNRLLPFLF
jgi:hypothetical protein